MNGLRKRYVFTIWGLEIIINLDKYKVTDIVKDLERKGHVWLARHMIGWELMCFVCLRVLNDNLVFCTMQVSSKTSQLSTLILLLHRMLGCFAILLYSPLIRPYLGLNFFREQASNSTAPTMVSKRTSFTRYNDGSWWALLLSCISFLILFPRSNIPSITEEIGIYANGQVKFFEKSHSCLG